MFEEEASRQFFPLQVSLQYVKCFSPSLKPLKCPKMALTTPYCIVMHTRATHPSTYPFTHSFIHSFNIRSFMIHNSNSLIHLYPPLRITHAFLPTFLHALHSHINPYILKHHLNPFFHFDVQQQFKCVCPLFRLIFCDASHT